MFFHLDYFTQDLFSHAGSRLLAAVGKKRSSKRQPASLNSRHLPVLSGHISRQGRDYFQL